MDRIQIKWNAAVAQLYEDAIWNEGAIISSSGALINFGFGVSSISAMNAAGRCCCRSVSGGLCNLATKVKHLVRIDDALDLFAEHAVGGIVGLILNGFFGDRFIIALDGVNTTVDGGFMNRNWAALYKQVCYVLATCGYAFVVTALIAKGVDMIPGLRLRAGPMSEALGMDEVEHGEFATDYIELRRDFAAAPFITYDHDASSPKAAGDRHGHTDLSVNDTARSEDTRQTDLPPINDKNEANR